MMANRLAEIAERQATVRQLDSLITAMRGLAAMRAEQSRQKLAPIRAYTDTVVEGLAQALSLVAETSDAGADTKTEFSPPASVPAAATPKSALILIGSEQGFVGALNEKLWSALPANSHECPLLVVGRRTAAFAEERGRRISRDLPMATHPDSVPALAHQMAEWLYHQVAEARISRADVIFCTAKPGGTPSVERRIMLPFDRAAIPPRLRVQPVHHYLPAAQLVGQMVAEYVFAQLCEAATLALAAENEARLTTMANAKRNIEDIAEHLLEDERLSRQAAITEELIELSVAVGGLGRG